MKSFLFFILIVSVIIITIYRVLKKSALKDKNYSNDEQQNVSISPSLSKVKIQLPHYR